MLLITLEHNVNSRSKFILIFSFSFQIYSSSAVVGNLKLVRRWPALNYVKNNGFVSNAIINKNYLCEFVVQNKMRHTKRKVINHKN